MQASTTDGAQLVEPIRRFYNETQIQVYGIMSIVTFAWSKDDLPVINLLESAPFAKENKEKVEKVKSDITTLYAKAKAQLPELTKADSTIDSLATAYWYGDPQNRLFFDAGIKRAEELAVKDAETQLYKMPYHLALGRLTESRYQRLQKKCPSSSMMVDVAQELYALIQEQDMSSDQRMEEEGTDAPSGDSSEEVEQLKQKIEELEKKVEAIQRYIKTDIGVLEANIPSSATLSADLQEALRAAKGGAPYDAKIIPAEYQRHVAKVTTGYAELEIAQKELEQFELKYNEKRTGSSATLGGLSRRSRPTPRLGENASSIGFNLLSVTDASLATAHLNDLTDRLSHEYTSLCNSQMRVASANMSLSTAISNIQATQAYGDKSASAYAIVTSEEECVVSSAISIQTMWSTIAADLADVSGESLQAMVTDHFFVAWNQAIKNCEMSYKRTVLETADYTKQIQAAPSLRFSIKVSTKVDMSSQDTRDFKAFAKARMEYDEQIADVAIAVRHFVHVYQQSYFNKRNSSTPPTHKVNEVLQNLLVIIGKLCSRGGLLTWNVSGARPTGYNSRSPPSFQNGTGVEKLIGFSRDEIQAHLVEGVKSHAEHAVAILETASMLRLPHEIQVAKTSSSSLPVTSKAARLAVPNCYSGPLQFSVITNNRFLEFFIAAAKSHGWSPVGLEDLVKRSCDFYDQSKLPINVLGCGDYLTCIALAILIFQLPPADQLYLPVLEKGNHVSAELYIAALLVLNAGTDGCPKTRGGPRPDAATGQTLGDMFIGTALTRALLQNVHVHHAAEHMRTRAASGFQDTEMVLSHLTQAPKGSATAAAPQSRVTADELDTALGSGGSAAGAQASASSAGASIVMEPVNTQVAGELLYDQKAYFSPAVLAVVATPAGNPYQASYDPRSKQLIYIKDGAKRSLPVLGYPQAQSQSRELSQRLAKLFATSDTARSVELSSRGFCMLQEAEPNPSNTVRFHPLLLGFDPNASNFGLGHLSAIVRAHHRLCGEMLQKKQGNERQWNHDSELLTQLSEKIFKYMDENNKARDQFKLAELSAALQKEVSDFVDTDLVRLRQDYAALLLRGMRAVGACAGLLALDAKDSGQIQSLFSLGYALVTLAFPEKEMADLVVTELKYDHAKKLLDRPPQRLTRYELLVAYTIGFWSLDTVGLSPDMTKTLLAHAVNSIRAQRTFGSHVSAVSQIPWMMQNMQPLCVAVEAIFSYLAVLRTGFADADKREAFYKDANALQTLIFSSEHYKSLLTVAVGRESVAAAIIGQSPIESQQAAIQATRTGYASYQASLSQEGESLNLSQLAAGRQELAAGLQGADQKRSLAVSTGIAIPGTVLTEDQKRAARSEQAAINSRLSDKLAVVASDKFFEMDKTVVTANLEVQRPRKRGWCWKVNQWLTYVREKSELIRALGVEPDYAIGDFNISEEQVYRNPSILSEIVPQQILFVIAMRVHAVALRAPEAVLLKLARAWWQCPWMAKLSALIGATNISWSVLAEARNPQSLLAPGRLTQSGLKLVTKLFSEQKRFALDVFFGAAACSCHWCAAHAKFYNRPIPSWGRHGQGWMWDSVHNLAMRRSAMEMFYNRHGNVRAHTARITYSMDHLYWAYIAQFRSWVTSSPTPQEDTIIQKMFPAASPAHTDMAKALTDNKATPRGYHPAFLRMRIARAGLTMEQAEIDKALKRLKEHVDNIKGEPQIKNFSASQSVSLLSLAEQLFALYLRFEVFSGQGYLFTHGFVEMNAATPALAPLAWRLPGGIHEAVRSSAQRSLVDILLTTAVCCYRGERDRTSYAGRTRMSDFANDRIYAAQSHAHVGYALRAANLHLVERILKQQHRSRNGANAERYDPSDAEIETFCMALAKVMFIEIPVDCHYHSLLSSALLVNRIQHETSAPFFVYNNCTAAGYTVKETMADWHAGMPAYSVRTAYMTSHTYEPENTKLTPLIGPADKQGRIPSQQQLVSIANPLFSTYSEETIMRMAMRTHEQIKYLNAMPTESLSQLEAAPDTETLERALEAWHKTDTLASLLPEEMRSEFQDHVIELLANEKHDARDRHLERQQELMTLAEMQYHESRAHEAARRIRLRHDLAAENYKKMLTSQDRELVEAYKLRQLTLRQCVLQRSELALKLRYELLERYRQEVIVLLQEPEIQALHGYQTTSEQGHRALVACDEALCGGPQAKFELATLHPEYIMQCGFGNHNRPPTARIGNRSIYGQDSISRAGGVSFSANDSSNAAQKLEARTNSVLVNTATNPFTKVNVMIATRAPFVFTQISMQPTFLEGGPAIIALEQPGMETTLATNAETVKCVNHMRLAIASVQAFLIALNELKKTIRAETRGKFNSYEFNKWLQRLAPSLRRAIRDNAKDAYNKKVRESQQEASDSKGKSSSQVGGHATSSRVPTTDEVRKLHQPGPATVEDVDPAALWGN